MDPSSSPGHLWHHALQEDHGKNGGNLCKGSILSIIDLRQTRQEVHGACIAPPGFSQLISLSFPSIELHRLLDTQSIRSYVALQQIHTFRCNIKLGRCWSFNINLVYPKIFRNIEFWKGGSFFHDRILTSFSFHLPPPETPNVCHFSNPWYKLNN